MFWFENHRMAYTCYYTIHDDKKWMRVPVKAFPIIHVIAQSLI